MNGRLNIDLLRRLCAANGTSGREHSVRGIILQELERIGIPQEDITVDRLGNILVHCRGQKPAKQKILCSAHMDEVALMVTYIHEDGTLAFDTVGGINAAAVIGRQVQVGRERISGVIGCKPVHLLSKDARTKPAAMGSLFCDIGANDKAEAMQYVSLGDIIYFCDDACIFGEDSFCSKAIDDRFGCALLLSMISPNLQSEMWFSFVVQEEIGLRGAGCAAYQINPDIAVVFEATTAADIAGSEGADQVCRLGGGAVISFMDGRTVYDKALYDHAVQICEKNHIAWQTKTKIAGGNDAGSIQSAGAGVRVLAVSVPCRYLHAPQSVIRLSDAEECAKLAEMLLLTLTVFGDQI